MQPRGGQPAPGSPSLRRLLVATFRRVMRLYFRDIERVGETPTAATRGRVFVSNHYNALIDPILVLTDAPCEISPVAKSTLWDVPGLRWLLDRAGAVPIIRRKDSPDKQATSNDAAFDRIASHLATGGNILIFPEGTSHSEPQLAPLKSGAARMLLAAEKAGSPDVTFQAAALEFDQRDDFRSRALVLWGPVRRFAEVDADDADGDARDEARVRAATAQMDADLRDLLVDADTHDDRRLIARVAEILAHNTGDASLRGWSDVGRQVELASRTLRSVDPELVKRVAEQVGAYYAALARLGLRDLEISGEATPPRELPPPAWTSQLRRIAMAPLAASGFVLYALPYFIPRYVARKTDPDAISTIKLGAALVIYPVWAAGLVTASFVLLPMPLSLVGAFVALASPFAALDWLDRYWQRSPSVSADDRATLTRLRTAALAAIDEARAKLPA